MRRKLSGSPRFFIMSDGEQLRDFYRVVETHLDVEPYGDLNDADPSTEVPPGKPMHLRPSLYWERTKRILRDYAARKGIVNGEANVSRSPSATLKQLEKIEKTARKLKAEIKHSHDAESAIFHALEDISRPDVMDLPFLGFGAVMKHLDHLCLAAGHAHREISKHIPEGTKKITHWPGYVDPDWHLVIDLAGLYHTQFSNPELEPWTFAREGCVNTGSGDKLYSGPFFDFVQDCFDALQITEHSTNRALGDLILRALDRWEELRAQEISLPS